MTRYDSRLKGLTTRLRQQERQGGHRIVVVYEGEEVPDDVTEFDVVLHVQYDQEPPSLQAEREGR